MRQFITHRQSLTITVVSLFILIALPRVADAVVIVSSSIIKIADTNTLVPNGGGATFAFFDRPAISGQKSPSMERQAAAASLPLAFTTTSVLLRASWTTPPHRLSASGI